MAGDKTDRDRQCREFFHFNFVSPTLCLVHSSSSMIVGLEYIGFKNKIFPDLCWVGGR